MKQVRVCARIRNKSNSIRHIFTGAGTKHVKPGEILTCGPAYAESMIHGLPEIWERVSEDAKRNDTPAAPVPDPIVTPEPEPTPPAAPSKPAGHKHPRHKGGAK
jgi:hypothetical protein